VRGLVKAFSGSDRAESQRRTVTANQPKMEGERFPLAGISVAIAVVVAVIIVVEIVRSWRAPAPHPPAGRSSEPVRTAIEPPPPYVD
jgi:hypothetical protein